MKSVPRSAVVLSLLAGLVAVVAVPTMMRARLAHRTGGPPTPASGTGPRVGAPTIPPATVPAPRTSSVPLPARPRAVGRTDEALAGAPFAAPVVIPGASAASLAQKIAREAEIDRFSPGLDTEAYDRVRDNPFLAVSTNPLSTFSIDVDTASYANVRRFLARGQLPPKDAVRIEELLNYFRYDYPEPRGETPFSVTTEVGRCPWKPEHRLVLVGLRGRSLEEAAVPPRRLTFLLDVSGSMDEPNKLPLLKEALALLVESLREQDRVAIAVYAGSSGLVLPPTSGDRKAEIRDALASLEAGGTTAGGAGIQLAYRVAQDMFLPGGVNRVVLATDGDFNVGITSLGELSRLIEDRRRTGVFLSVLGFGEGNLKDSTMETLADRGNGNYSYIDDLGEARKVLVSEAGGTLVTIAKDVKIQVEMNPRRVAAYRLLGYENRLLRAEDFADDRKDAGEIGAGHTVTALYEIVPPGATLDLPGVDPLRYQGPAALSPAAATDELLTVKLRYKDPEGETSRLLSAAVRDDRPASRASGNLRFAAAVAEFGLLLRESEHRGGATWAQVRELAEGARGRDAGGYREAFLDLARRAEELSSPRQAAIAR
jgi:Ca-activated chloride channel family protein